MTDATPDRSTPRYSQDDVSDWSYLLELMRANAVYDGDSRMVTHAVAKISSGAGLVNSSMPGEIVALICEAIETGYASALNDVREGEIDGVGPLPVDD